jgi:hypothetical protein
MAHLSMHWAKWIDVFLLNFVEQLIRIISWISFVLSCFDYGCTRNNMSQSSFMWYNCSEWHCKTVNSPRFNCKICVHKCRTCCTIQRTVLQTLTMYRMHAIDFFFSSHCSLVNIWFSDVDLFNYSCYHTRSRPHVYYAIYVWATAISQYTTSL